MHRGEGSSQTPPEKWFSNYSSAGRHVSLICARGRRSATGDRYTQFAAAPPAIWILRQSFILTMWSSIRHLVSATLTDTRTACPSVRHQNVWTFHETRHGTAHTNTFRALPRQLSHCLANYRSVPTKANIFVSFITSRSALGNTKWTPWGLAVPRLRIRGAIPPLYNKSSLAIPYLIPNGRDHSVIQI